mgnify:CR=1 FL=1
MVINSIGYAGSLFMVIFSFTLSPIYGISGLVLLTFQALKLKAYNLVALNLVSIIGLLTQI